MNDFDSTTVRYDPPTQAYAPSAPVAVPLPPPPPQRAPTMYVGETVPVARQRPLRISGFWQVAFWATCIIALGVKMGIYEFGAAAATAYMLVAIYKGWTR